MVTKSILLVEDQTNMRLGLAELLTGEGYRVDTVADGQQALDLLETGLTPDLLLVDLSLPKVTGSELLRYAHEDPNLRAVPTIVITATPREQIDVVADEVFSKPVEIPQLLSSLKRLMA
jgi:CheY-like chemotaxis protein